MNAEKIAWVRLPPAARQLWHGIEVLIAAEHGQSVLQRERSNPRIVGRDGGALLPERDA